MHGSEGDWVEGDRDRRPGPSGSGSLTRRGCLGGIVAAGAVALAGCTGSGSDAPPPRKSHVVPEIELESGVLAVEVAADGYVVSRREVPVERASLGALSPVGTASAQKGGRGSTGRGRGGYSDAPRTGNGRARYHGGAYVGTWYDDHDDETRRYPVVVQRLGVAYLGTNAAFQDSDPGPGPVDWDVTESEPDLGAEVPIELPADGPGWYRVGADVAIAPDVLVEDDVDRDLGWECVDLRLEPGADGLEITERWKVSPRI